MQKLTNINIGVRAQAGLVLTLVVFWFISIAGWGREMGDHHAFWTEIFLLGPFLSGAFAVLLFASYRRAGRIHRGWVVAALWAAASPWILLLLFVGLGWVWK